MGRLLLLTLLFSVTLAAQPSPSVPSAVVPFPTAPNDSTLEDADAASMPASILFRFVADNAGA